MHFVNLPTKKSDINTPLCRFFNIYTVRGQSGFSLEKCPIISTKINIKKKETK